MAPELERVDHIHVFVTDRSASKAWYAQVMGFTPLAELEFWSADGGPLTISNRSGTIHLALFQSAARQCRSTIALGATAVEFLAWRKHLGAVLGRPVEAVDHAVAWSLYFSDPDQNPFEITSYEYASIALALDNAAT